LTDLTGTLWRLRQPKPITRAFGTRNTKHIAIAPERLRSAGLVEGRWSATCASFTSRSVPAASSRYSATALRSWPAAMQSLGSSGA